ncbi:dendritic cell-specific transmembrane protein-like [Acipenser ruthenus]|uniref:dendritic cell-specific transmembrane protein-like n=1 Tax=Acipenser ruthenus TaxID=7906 RepID=UPI00145B621D|nr:dendritic cell-specific transmembrane protein-like [Acipenser ruthenus]XP_033915034.1 dendritic cell-specific transmembrane protein-like [Acipenser ruthenus]XP_058868669.1 dendritic cell-specific transmembrane protein-like [Acipenser ruthenus]
MPLRIAVAQAWAVALELYTTNTLPGWRNKLCLFVICFFLGLVFGGLLFLGLHLSVGYTSLVSLYITSAMIVLVTAILFFFKQARCFSMLFLVSCGMQQGRNILITAGTGVVIVSNVRNTFNNLHGLAKSMICNLEAKKLSIDTTPVGKYIGVIKWIYDQTKVFSNLLDLVTFTPEFHIEHTISTHDLKEKLQNAEQQVKEVSENVSKIMDTMSSIGQKVLPALGVFLVLISTVFYIRKYYFNKKFENTFITPRFIRFDKKQKADGKPHILPLTKKERKKYVTIPSPRLSGKERKRMGVFLIPVLTHTSVWAFFMGVDALLYWLILTISKHLEGVPPIMVALRMTMDKENRVFGIIPETSSSESQDFSYNVTLFEKKCIPKPTLLIQNSSIPLVAIILILMLLGLMSAKLTELKLLVVSSFYPDNEDERIEYLHTKILKKRSKKRLKPLKSTLIVFAKKLDFWFPVFSFFRKQEDDRNTLELD